MPDNDFHPPPPPKLDYAFPGRGTPAMSVGWFFGGLLSSVAVAIFCVFLMGWIGGAYNAYAFEGPKGRVPRLVSLPTQAVVLAALVGLLALAIRQHRRKRWRGFLPGVLLGLILAALPVGVCFVGMA